MNIGFDEGQWKRLAADADLWWRGELERPMISLTLRHPDRGPSPTEEYRLEYDPAQPVERLLDRLEERLASEVYIGDAFPTVRPSFGAGCNAAFCGARAEVGQDTVWFHPDRPRDLSDLPLEFDPDNIWWRRLTDVYRAAQRRWGRRVCLGMADMTPGLDTLHVFRPGEQLLLDLYDQPQLVLQQVARAEATFLRHISAVHELLAPINPGYTCWPAMFSTRPHYMLQCDFCYMIGPDMFARFVRPGLDNLCRQLPHNFYHLDGPGQLPHLNHILSLPHLKGVQWVPGAGVPDERHWPDVYRRIRAAGKLVQVFGNLDTLETIARQVGSARGIWLIGGAKPEDEAELRRAVRRWGVQ